MTTVTQLDPPLVLFTPYGKAVCHFLIDYGFEADLMWVCFQQDTGQCWCWRNDKIRIDNNATIGRTNVIPPPQLPPLQQPPTVQPPIQHDGVSLGAPPYSTGAFTNGHTEKH